MQGDVYDKDKQTVCPECGSKELIGDYERAEVVCANCGLVIDENLVDMGPEWRAFDHEQRDKRTRVGAPITYTIHDKGLSTMIDWRNKDIYGRDIPARNRAQWYRLRKWQRKIRISGATERNLAFALSELDRDSSRLGLPRSVRESASVVYRSAVDNKLIRGRSIEGVVAASLYAACRRCNVPRTLDEIAEVSRVTKKEVGRTYRFLTRELNIKLPPTSPVDYVPRFASELGLSGEAQSRAIEIIEKAMGKGVKLLLPIDTKIGKEFKPDTESKTVAWTEIPDEWEGFDIGEKTIEMFKKELQTAKTVIWNGPLGLFEFDQFAVGTNEIAKALSELNATTIIGGGDSGAAVEKAGLADKMTHISTGGGASLEFLEGKKLPGIECLQDK